ncbi:MAG: FTR1 family iron permease [Carbonactinosporaceae bacterium]
MITSLLIMVREGFEAALIVAIIYAYIGRIERPDLMRPMWNGVLAAVALSAALGAVIHLTVDALEGEARLRAFAAISVFAAVVLTWMVFWMRRHARGIKGELQRSIDSAVAGGGSIRWAVAAAAFFAVIREGLEAALFLIAAATTTHPGEVLLGGVAGIAIASALGYVVVLGGRRLPLQKFFTVTGVMLIVFAAGLLARAVAFLQYSGDLAIWVNNVYDLTGYAWLTVDTEVGKFLGAMFGWDPRPSIEQVIVWLAYLGIVTTLFLRGSRPPKPDTRAEPAPAEQRV